MIDWITCVIPWLGTKIYLNRIEENPRTGEFKIKRTIPEVMRGSYDDALTVETKEGELWISGNPVKFFSGQNVVGTNNIDELIGMSYKRVCEVFEVDSCKIAEAALMSGNVRLTRVDCTCHYAVGTDENVNTWLEAMGQACHVKYRGRGLYEPSMACLLFGVKPAGEGKAAKGSRHSTFKFYNKFFELNKKRPNCPEHVFEKISKICYGEVRAEALYRGRELKQLGLNKVSEWTEDTAEMLNRRWIEKMEISRTVDLNERDVYELAPALRMTYTSWKSGSDVRQLLSRPTFYRHRRSLLEQGIDIAIIQDTEIKPKAVPVMRVLEAKPVCERSREQMFWELVEAA